MSDYSGSASWCTGGAWNIPKGIVTVLLPSNWYTTNSSDRNQSDAIGDIIMQPNGELKAPNNGTFLLSTNFQLSDFTQDPSASLKFVFTYHPRNEDAQSPDYVVSSFTLTNQDSNILRVQRCIMKEGDVFSVTIESNIEINIDSVGNQSFLRFDDVTMDNSQVLFNGVALQPPEYDAGNKISQMQEAKVIGGQSSLILTQDGTKTGQSFFQSVIAYVNIEVIAIKPVDLTVLPVKTVSWIVQPIDPEMKTVNVVVTYSSTGMLVNDDEYYVKARIDGN